MKKSFIIIALLAMVFSLKAQIGYQVSLLNTATGEPRANESVEVIIEITDSEGTSICKETKNATTNDFGVLSLQVGNATTFENADWSKLPFYVSATVDDILVGKSQILNVPVAEAAKTLVGNVSKSDIVGEWLRVNNNSKDESEEDVSSNYYCVFNADGTYLIAFCYFDEEDGIEVCNKNEGYFYILGKSIQLISSHEEISIAWASYNDDTKILKVDKHYLNGKWGCYEYEGKIFIKQN